jgi:hypothetical protein
MYVCIMRQCFNVGTSCGSWLGLTIPVQGWDVTVVQSEETKSWRAKFVAAVSRSPTLQLASLAVDQNE